MLPRDESAAYAIDDTILLARTIAQYINFPLETSFQIYESLRRSDITLAFKESLKLWKKRNADANTFESWIRERLVPFQIRNTQVSRRAAFEFDASKAAIPTSLSSRSASPFSLRPSSKSRSSLSSTDTLISGRPGSEHEHRQTQKQSSGQVDVRSLGSSSNAS